MGRGVSPQIPNCHFPYKEEAARGNNYKGMQHAKREVIKKKKKQKRAGIPSKKKGNPVEKGDTTKILGNLNHSRVGFRQPTSSGG